MVEVLISGGGPAGAAAAIVLARRGVRVLVAERDRFPRDAACGDTLSPGAVAELRALGLEAPIGERGTPLRGVRVVRGRREEVIDHHGDAVGLAIRRRDLDALLLEAAAAAGAQVREATRVVGPLLDEGSRPVVRGAVLETAGRQVRVPATVTIAAEGRRSTLASAVGLLREPRGPRRCAFSAHFAGVTGLDERREIHLGRGHDLCVAPLPGGLACVCLVGRGAAEGDGRTVLLDALSRDPRLGERSAGASLVSPVTSVDNRAIDVLGAGAPGLLLAGDAAGIVEPMTGEGLRLAVRGGVLAAQVALAVLEQPALQGHRRLARLRRQELGRVLRLSRLLKEVAAIPSAGWLAPAVLRRFTRC
jgi:flavin-dependent dehydrogenase